MTKRLEMIFRDEAGKEATLSLANPKDDLTKAGVMAVMQTVATKRLFQNKNGALVTPVSCQVHTQDTQSLA